MFTVSSYTLPNSSCLCAPIALRPTDNNSIGNKYTFVIYRKILSLFRKCYAAMNNFIICNALEIWKYSRPHTLDHTKGTVEGTGKLSMPFFKNKIMR
jgi:hypothetical protein